VVNPNLIGVEHIRDRLQCTEDTVRRYFRKRILHAHSTAENGVSYLSDRASVEVRLTALHRLRPECKDLGKLGMAFRTVSGDDDSFILDRVSANEEISQVTRDFIGAVRLILKK
jgi:hypothetical protein